MATDSTEPIRRQRLAEINSEAHDRASLESKYGQVWDTDQMRSEFEPMGFMAPYLVVRRRSDGIVGSVEFSHQPRFYFNFVPDKR